MQLSEKYQLVRKLARDFAEKELTSEILDEVEDTGVFPVDIQKKDGKGRFLRDQGSGEVRRPGFRSPGLRDHRRGDRAGQRGGQPVCQFSEFSGRYDDSHRRYGRAEAEISASYGGGRYRHSFRADRAGRRFRRGGYENDCREGRKIIIS